MKSIIKYFIVPTAITIVLGSCLENHVHPLIESENINHGDSTDISFYLNFENGLLSHEKEAPVKDETLVFTSGISGMGLCFGPNDILQYSAEDNISYSEGALSIWLKPNWYPGDNKLYRILYYGTSPKNFEMHVDENKLIAIGANSVSHETIRVAYGDGSSWIPGQWHHVVFSWSSKYVKVYIDGKLHEQTTVGYEFPFEDDTVFHIGSVEGKEGFDGVIDEVTIISRELNSDEVREYYDLMKAIIPSEQIIESCEYEICEDC